MTVKAIIFDWGGTCTKGSIANNFSHLLSAMTIVSSRRINIIFEKNCRKYLLGELTGRTFWKSFAKETGIEEKPDFFITLFRESGKAEPEILALVKSLGKKYKIALLSDNYKDLVDHIVRIYRLKELFDTLIFSNEVGMKKPGKDIFNFAIKKLHIRPHEAVFIDDKRANVNVAKKLGMRGIHFTSADKLKKELAKLGIRGFE